MLEAWGDDGFERHVLAMQVQPATGQPPVHCYATLRPLLHLLTARLEPSKHLIASLMAHKQGADKCQGGVNS